MANISIVFYKNNKKVNSTKLPLNSVITLEGNFQESSSIYNPTIHISAIAQTSIIGCNYFSITWPNDVFTVRYYWLTDSIIVPNGYLAVSGSEDIYATARNNILGSMLFCERINMPIEGRFTDLSLDTLYKHSYKVDKVDFDLFSLSRGFFVVGCVAKEVRYSETSGANTYSFTKGGINYYTFSYNDLLSFFDLFKNLTGYLTDYSIEQYFVSCNYIPIAIYNDDETAIYLEQEQVNTKWLIGYGEQEIYLEMTGRTKIIFPNNESGQFGVLNLCSQESLALELDCPLTPLLPGIKNHPQFSNELKFLNTSPYSKVSINIGPFGNIEVPTNLLDDNEYDASIQYIISIDVVSGLAKIDLFEKTIVDSKGYMPEVLASKTISLGIPVQWATIKVDSQAKRIENNNTLSTGLTSAVIESGTALRTSPLIGAVSTVQNVINSKNIITNYMLQAYQNNIPQVTTNGSNASGLNYNVTDIYIMYDWVLINRPFDGIASLSATFNKFVGSLYNGYLLPILLYTRQNMLYIQTINAKLIRPERYTIIDVFPYYLIEEGTQLQDNSYGLTINEIMTICTQLDNGMFIE